MAESIVLFVTVWCICHLKDRFPEWGRPPHLEDRWKSSAAEVCPIWTGWQDPLQEYIYSEYPVQLRQNFSVPGSQVVIDTAWSFTRVWVGVFVIRCLLGSLCPQMTVNLKFPLILENGTWLTLCLCMSNYSVGNEGNINQFHICCLEC
jgi:hypothetical protein